MKKAIWILWWMWPEASLYLYKNVLEYCQKHFQAIQDTDYPHMIINNIWLEGFDETWVVDEELVKKWLVKWITELDNAGVEKIVMACNTVHLYYDFLQKNTKWNVINLVDETVKKVKKADLKKVLVIGSNTTNKTWLYDKYLEKYNIEYFKVNTKEQKKLDEIIENIMGNKQTQDDFDFIEKISYKYKKLWAEGIIVGCTELPIVTYAEKNPLKVFDTLEILTQMIIEY